MNIYLASSWKHPLHPPVVEILRAAQFSVYDYRHPEGPEDGYGFDWREVDPNWESWTLGEMASAFNHPLAQKGFAKDAEALKACDAVILLLPSGLSAHMEFAWAGGRLKPCFIYYPADLGETRAMVPELMYMLGRNHTTDAGMFHDNQTTLLAALRIVRRSQGLDNFR